MTNTQRWVVVGAGAVIVAGLVGAAVVAGLEGVEVMSWLAGSASLLVAVVALVVVWPAPNRTDRPLAPPATAPAPVPVAAQAERPPMEVPAEPVVAPEPVAAREPAVAREPAAAQEPAPGGSAGAGPASTGPVRQQNTGGVNIANSGVIGSIDLSQ
ncbi:hypothetical protein [Catellatospora coxensis]|uniref:Uncharacterized protein n=1 Tax=Catellatospora coxensis TaxID=310354 RepID=A0A8J3KNK7_9ACTN|nr:hypothetical protein [Catellatospora coxensis]GIG06252.1 hypothetical protein Cco03nite_29520 [Catellatospora coxensis]